MSDSVALNVKLQHEVSAIPSLKERLEAYRAAKCEAVRVQVHSHIDFSLDLLANVMNCTGSQLQ